MAFLQWRRFNFFEKEVVKENEGKVFEKLKDININACTSGRGYMIFGDVEGFIYMLNRQLELIYFRAFELTVNHLHQLRQNGILVSVGEDVPGNNSVIKIWNIDKPDKNGIPTCTRTVSAGNRETPVTALAVNENMNMMALGYDNGSVLLLRGDITRDRGSKQKILHEGTHPVTGLSFRTMPKTTHLFIATTDNIFSYNVSMKDKEQQFHLDSHGCIPRCSTMSDAKLEYQFVIARTEAVYFYQPDGRGPCFAFDGEKIILHWFRSYLVIVGKDRTAVRPGPVSSHTLAMNIVTVYDIQNKFIAYSAPLPEVIDILSEWGSLYVLGGDKKLYHLQEKDTQSKLDTLFKKSLYALAIELAKTQQYDEEGVVDIFRQYGDHLYSKGDHDGAIEQYIKTIGKLEASYVIRKFLDAQRIHNLTAYLQALHRQGLATEDHTTLLLNCYTKLKANDKLDEFIKTKNGDIDFDIEIAIRVCRQANYYDHALYLAEKHSQHDWYLKIQIEDLQQYQKALEYISKLEFDEAESNMKKYGKVLLTEVPEKTTELLKQLCTDYRPSDKPLIDANMLDGSIKQIQRAEAKDFIHIFVKNSKRLQEFLEHIIKVQKQSQSLVYNTLLELYLQEYMHESNPAAQKIHEKTIVNLLEMPDAGYDLDQALVLCQMNNFKPGLLYLYEKAKLYQQILQYHMARTDYDNIIVTCKHFGSQDPNLWVQALWFFSKTDDNQKNYLIEVLDHIEQKKLLSPLMVINILSNSSTATLGVVKEYIIRQLEKENHQIAEDERLIQQYREATQTMRSEIEDIKTNAKIFKVAKCSACNQQLELPSVHFLCHHSYHLHCFESYAENENECPACTTENRKILDIIRAQEQSKDLHEQFHHLLDNAEDGFSVVSEYFGRGIFNRVTLITDLPSKNKAPLPGIREQIFEPEFSLPGLSFRSESRQLPSQAPSLNPFESPQGLNPFDEYDDQLNPFKT